MLFNKVRPFMMLALPNTGTDWFVSQICDSNEKLKYYREYFNPITNHICPDKIATIFGCELSETINTIAKPCSWQQYKAVLDATWNKDKFNFTKENYSIFQIHHHCRAFNCFVLHRELEYCLPSLNRLNDVNSWYDAIYQSIANNIILLDSEIQSIVAFAKKHADTLSKRTAAAHIIGYRQILKSAQKFNLPVIEYNTLMDGTKDEITFHLQALKLCSPERLAEKIIKSRHHRQNVSDRLNCNAFIEELRKIK